MDSDFFDAIKRTIGLQELDISIIHQEQLNDTTLIVGNASGDQTFGLIATCRNSQPSDTDEGLSSKPSRVKMHDYALRLLGCHQSIVYEGFSKQTTIHILREKHTIFGKSVAYTPSDVRNIGRKLGNMINLSLGQHNDGLLKFVHDCPSIFSDESSSQYVDTILEILQDNKVTAEGFQDNETALKIPTIITISSTSADSSNQSDNLATEIVCPSSLLFDLTAQFSDCQSGKSRLLILSQYCAELLPACEFGLRNPVACILILLSGIIERSGAHLTSVEIQLFANLIPLQLLRIQQANPSPCHLEAVSIFLDLLSEGLMSFTTVLEFVVSNPTTSNYDIIRRVYSDFSCFPPTIAFVTGNIGKLREMKSIFNELYGSNKFRLISHNIDLEEIQGSPVEIATRKCQAAVLEVGGAVVIEDTSLCFHALGDMPGPYIKWFVDHTGIDGLVQMLNNFSNQSAHALCCMAFCAGPGHPVIVFEGRVDGQIVLPRGDRAFGWDPIFEPHGSSLTLAEMDGPAKDKVSHRRNAIELLGSYLSDHYLELIDFIT